MKIDQTIDGEHKTFINVRTGTVHQHVGPGTSIISYLENDGVTRVWVGSVTEEVTHAAQTLVGVWEASPRLRAELPVAEGSDSGKCPSCECETVTLNAVVHRFEYGCDDRTVMLMAVVPVFTCGYCKLKWLNECGHVLIEHAITQHLESIKNPKLPDSPKLMVPTGSMVIVVDEQSNKSKVIKGPAIIDDRLFHSKSSLLPSAQ